MATRRSAPVVAALVASLLGIAACAGDDDGGGGSGTTAPPGSTASVPSACDVAVDEVLDATQRYVRGYESATAVSVPADPSAPTTATTAPPTLSEAEFQEALAAAEATFRSGCDPLEVRGGLTAGLTAVEAEGPVADAVLRRLSASMVGELPTEATTTRVEVGDDLREVLATSPDGSTVELAPGEHRLDSSLVLLNGVVLRGAGRDATTIVSSAPDAALVVLTDRRVELRDLGIRREGEAPGSGVLGGATSSILVQGVRISGGRLDAGGEGGAGILMFGADLAQPSPATTLEVTDTELRENQGAGVVLTGGHRASLVGVTFAANLQCGLCFLDAAGGSVEDSVFEGNGIAVAATGSAAPALLRLAISGGEVGVQAVDDAAPILQAVTVTGAVRAAVLYGGRAAGAIDGLTCVDVPFGIVVGPEASPQLGATDCDLAASE